jgi:hypothetical protein
MQIERPALKKIALELCTCTWIEILTGVGITLCLFFGLNDPKLAVLTVCLFAPLIAFHFAVSSLLPRRKNIIKIKPMSKNQRSQMKSTSEDSKVLRQQYETKSDRIVKNPAALLS